MSAKKYSKSLFTANWHKIHKEGEMLFDSLFAPKHPFSEKHWQPYTDIFETEDAFVIKMEIPGIKKEDISITVVGKKLTIRGTRHDLDIDKIISYQQMEINYSDFERSTILPMILENLKIKAEYKDGFLRIKIFKKPKEKEIYRTVEIK